MTEVENGSVENHGRELVAFEFYTGEAGVRRDGPLIEFAYFGEVPRRSQVGQQGMIGVDLCVVVELVRSKSRGMVSGRARKL